jgi:werner syndrome-like exonuclease
MKKSTRTLPQWMKGRKQAVNNAVGNIVQTNSSDNSKRKLRSSDPSSSQENDHFNAATNLPMMDYDGKISYYIDYFDIALCFESLLQKVNSMPGDDETGNIACAFDLEWPTDFKIGGGPMKTAVMQICIDIGTCYVIQMSKLDRIPASLTEFLYHQKIILHGVNIKNDLRKLGRDFPIINSDRLIEKCVDLGTYYNSVFASSQRW